MLISEELRSDQGLCADHTGGKLHAGCSERGVQGTLPSGVMQISSPNNSVLLIGRVLVDSDSDLPTAYNIEKQIRLTPSFKQTHMAYTLLKT